MRVDAEPRTARRIEIALGCLGFLGILSMIVGDGVGSWLRPGYNPIAQSVSLLARHRFNLPQDIGLYLMGTGGIACGIGLHFLLGRGWKRSALWILVVVAGLDVFVLTLFDLWVRQVPWALPSHEIASALMVVLLFVASWLFGIITWSDGKAYARLSTAVALAFTIMIPAYAFVPPAWDGLYERLLILDGLVWIGMVSWALVTGEQRIH